MKSGDVVHVYQKQFYMVPMIFITEYNDAYYLASINSLQFATAYAKKDYSVLTTDEQMEIERINKIQELSKDLTSAISTVVSIQEQIHTLEQTLED